MIGEVKITNFGISLTLFFIYLVCLPVISYAKEPVTHAIHSLFFEMIEGGVVSNKRVILEIDAAVDKGKPWAECRGAILYINDSKKHISVENFYSSEVV